MPRRRRQNVPGAPFHITARLQNGEPLFDGLQSRIVLEIDRSMRASGMRLLAYAVMSNHLHLVVVQGRDPLSWHMQGLLRRIALLVQRTHGRRGHVFERRFHSSLCLDPEYFRNIIAYVHLNAVRAGVCSEPKDYGFTSHFEYCASTGDKASLLELASEDALRVFAAVDNRTLSECRDDYEFFLEWRGAMDDFVGQGGDPRSGKAPVRPLCAGGDRYWMREFGYRRRRDEGAHLENCVPTLPDLEKIALRALNDLAPDLPLDILRSSGRSRPLVHVRRHVIARALEIGYRPKQIARYFRLAPGTVTAIAVALRASRAA
jgi:REP element-mobilizing transposase RayT